MNPELDIGQVEGAYMMGLGLWLTEKIIYDPQTGKNLTNGTWVSDIRAIYTSKNKTRTVPFIRACRI